MKLIRISGYDPHVRRPGFAHMLRDAKAGHFDILVVYALSRLTRKGFQDALDIHDELSRAGVVLVSVNEPFLDTSTGSGMGLFIMLAEMARQESAMKSRFIRDAKATLKNSGGWVGGHTPYGFTSVASSSGNCTVRRLELVPEEAAVIAEAAKRVLAGNSLRAVCAHLNSSGVATRRGGKWHGATLRRVLRDPRTAGYEAQPVATIKEGARKADYEYRIQRDGDGAPIAPHAAAIPSSDWEQLQHVLDTSASHAGGPGADKLLSGLGLLKCACGWAMSSGGPSRYQCKRPAGTDDGAHPGSRPVVAEALINQHIGRLLMTRLTLLDESDSADLALLSEASALWAQTAESAQAERGRLKLEEERRILDVTERQLHEDRRAGVYAGPIGREEFMKDAALIAAQRKGIQHQLEVITGLTSNPSLPLSLRTTHTGDIVGSGSWWRSATLDEQRQVIRLFIDRITVLPRRGGGRYDVSQRVELRWRASPRI